MLKRTFFIVCLFFNIILDAAIYDFTTVSGNNTQTLTSTVDGVTLTVTQSGGNNITVNTGFLYPGYSPSPETFTLSFSSPISVSSFDIGEFADGNGGNYVFTPNNGTVVLISDSDPDLNDYIATLNPSDWTNVSSIVVSYTSSTSTMVLGIDNINFTAVSSDSTGTLVSAGGVNEPINISTTATSSSPVNIFDFTIYDDQLGSGSDGLTLDINSLDLNLSGTASANFSKLRFGLAGCTTKSNIAPSGSKVTFSGAPLISVAEDGNTTCTVTAYWNDNTGITDNQTVSISIDGDTDLLLDGTKTQMSGSNSTVSTGNMTTPVTATALSFSTQPAGSVSGSNLTTQPIVKAVDAFGNVDTDFTETITLTEASAGALTGNTVTASSGVATFTALNYTATADQESFTLTANDQDGVGTNLSTVDANAVTSDVVATKLVFSTEPSPLSIQSGVATNLSTVPVVSAVDANDTVDTGYSTGITLTEVNGAGSSTMTATGDTDGDGSTVTITPSSGVSTFTSMQLTYTASGANSENFNLRASSGGLTTTDSSQMTGTTNNAPTLTSFTTFVDNVNEDSEVEITLTDLKVQADEADSDGTVDAFVVQSVSTGTLKIGTSSGTATAYASSTNDTIDSTNKAYWTPAQDANGTLNAFTVKAKDNDAALSSTAVQTQVSVTAVNDTPTLTLPSSPSINEDASNYAISDTINVADVDGDNLTVTLTSTNGTISVNSSSIGSFITGDGTDDTVIKFTESVANVNTTLDSLTFSPTADFDGTASIKVDIDDSTASVVTDTLNITVNNAPEITSITRGTPTDENTNADSLVFYAYIDSNIPSANDATASDFEVVGSTTATITNVVRQSIYYEVTVSGGDLASYNGIVGVKFVDDNSVKNSNGVPIGGDGVDNFTTGQTYTLDNTAPTANIGSATDDVGSVTGTLSSGDSTDDTALVLSGTNETGSSVSVYNGATLLGAATVTGTSWSYTATLADGTTYQFNVKETDIAGNESSATTNFTVIGDTSAPTANIGSATDDVGSVTGILSSGDSTDDTALVLSGTNETGSSVSVYNGATLLGAATVTGTSWSYTATLADGTTYQFNVKETDIAGNESSATANFTVTGDTSAPTANIGSATDDVGSVTGTLSSGDSTDDTALVLSGTNETGSSVSVYNGTTLLGAATVTGTSWSYTATLADGTTYQFNVKETDSAGNESSATANFTVIGDTTAPNTPATVDLSTSSDTGSSNTDNSTSDTTPTFSGTAEANSTITLISSIDGTIGTTTADSSGNWSITTTTLSAGNHDITVTSTDGVGNTSSTSIALSITIDSTVPTVVISSAKSTAINGEVLDLTFTLSEDSSDFTVDDISVSGGSLSEFTQSTSNTKVYTAKFTIDDTTTTQTTVDVNQDVFTDSVGNNNTAATQKVFTILPSVVKFTPTKDSTEAALNSSLVLEFSEVVTKGTTGTINIYKTSDDGLVESIDITDSKITIENPNSTNGLTNTTVTIAKSTQLDLVTGYYVTISNSAFKDVNDNYYAGISDKTSWAFTTIDNQAPVISNNSSNATAIINVDENQTAVIDIDATDADIGQTITYSISGTDASSFDIDSTTGVITFKTAPDHETKDSYSVTVKAADNSTVSLNDTQALTININDINEAPTSANNSFTINEDTSKTFALTDFTFNDVDNANTLNSIKIVTLPSKGSLQLNSSDVVVNQTILKADISKLTYAPAANENGTAYTSFTFKVNDGNLDSTSSYSMTVNVTAVDDAPEITTILDNKTQVEDGEGLVISLATSDIDSDASSATYGVTSSDQNIAKAYIRDGKLIVVPQKNANGDVTISLTSTVGGKSTTKTFTYSITSVNDAPTISGIDDITHEQTSSVINKTITFDIWDDVEITSLTATSSNENLLPNSSIVIPNAPYGSQSTLSYTISAANAGKSDITITAKDAEGLEYKESFKITVESQSDAQCVENAKTALSFDTIKLNNSFQDAISSNLDLVTDLSSVCDATILWNTTDSGVVDTSGAITQGTDDKTIMLKANISKGEFSAQKEFLVTVLSNSISDSEALSKLTFEFIKEQNDSKSAIISKLNLPTSILGEDIIWTSSDDSVISPYSGFVTRSTIEDKAVTLTATIGSESKIFELTVLKEESNDLDSVSKDKELLTINSLLGDNTDKNSIIYDLAKPLPTIGANGSSISWSSSNTAFITNEGDVLRDAAANKFVVLTATITKGSETTTKEFNFQVLQNKIETASSNTFVNAGTTNDGTQVTTNSGSTDTQTKSSFASTILSAVDTIVSQGSIQSIVEVAEKIVNIYLNTDGSTKSTLQTNSGSASLENKNVGSTTNVEDDGDIVSSNSDDTIRLKLNNDGSVTHEVVNNSLSKTSTATSKVSNSSVKSDESGNVETTSEVKKDGFIYKAIVSTNKEGKTNTKFVRVDLSTGEEDEVDNTVSSSTPFQAGNEVEISEIDGNLYIKTTTPLDGSLEIE